MACLVGVVESIRYKVRENVGKENQDRLGQFGGSKQARRNFEQSPLCDKCKK